VNPPQKTIEELIEDFRQGKDRQNSSRLIHERYCGKVYRFFQRKRLPPEVCDELTQETFSSVFNGLSNLRQVSSFETWLFKIARNTWLGWIETRKAEKRPDEDKLVSLDEEIASETGESRRLADYLADPGPNPEEAALKKEKLELLREAIEQLPPQMRRCVKLAAKDLTNQEIAEVMQISVNTVKAHRHQAEKILREKFSGD